MKLFAKPIGDKNLARPNAADKHAAGLFRSLRSNVKSEDISHSSLAKPIEISRA